MNLFLWASVGRCMESGSWPINSGRIYSYRQPVPVAHGQLRAHFGVF